MRMSIPGMLVAVTMALLPSMAHAQGSLTGRPASDFSVQLRNAHTGELSGSTKSHQAGQFSFASLQPGNHVVEIADAAGKVVGSSPSVPVVAGSVVTVTVGATAAGALAGGDRGEIGLRELGPLASVAIGGAVSSPAVATVIATGSGKLIVCHAFSEKSSQTLQINESAREVHVGHGDSLGACADRRGR
jgi:hypothetical protein